MGGIFSVISKLIWGEQSAQRQPQMDIQPMAGGAKEMEQLVAQVGDLKNGEMKEVELGQGKVLLCRDAHGEFSAVGSKCTHYAAPLKSGAYGNDRVRCPWHGACFNTKTGEIEDFPGMDGLPVFDVRVEGDNIYVKGDLEEVRTSKRQPHMCQHGGDRRVFVLVGGGAGSAAAAQELRVAGFAGRIVVISKEHALPYDRPKLSKAMTVGLETILLRPQNFWDEHGIEFKLGTVVTELDATTKTVTTDSGEKIVYDACLVATGGTPRGLPLPVTSAAAAISSTFKNVYLLRDYDQAGVIDAEAQGKKVVIVGSSFIGMEIAAAISSKASSVTVVGMEKVPFERVLGEQVGASLEAVHKSKGINFQMQAVVSDVEFEGHVVTKLKLNNGVELEADLICVGAGVIPAVSFIKGVELAKPDNSLLCDAFMRVKGAENLYAAGDIARFPLPLLNNTLVRIEHWGMALKQGQVAARNMVADMSVAGSSGAKAKAQSQPESVDSIPYFWTGMYGKTVRYCGHGIGVTKHIVDGGSAFDAENIKFLIFSSDKDGKIIACCSMNRDPLVSMVAELMQQKRMLSAAEVEDAIASDGSAEKLIRTLLEDKLAVASSSSS